jgi:AcrR family transcriptional regulator
VQVFTTGKWKDEVVSETVSDQRLLKGTRSRQAIARHAADVASVEGLNGLSIGRLATDLGLSKSGVATLFGTKERLQVAAVESAREVFVEHVVLPSRSEPHGLPRLRALIENWFAYVDKPVFPGGCFQKAIVTEFDSQPGVVRDAILTDLRDWLGLLEHEIGHAQSAGDLVGADASLTAFHIDAILAAANVAMQLGDEQAERKSRLLIEQILAS